MTPSEKFKRPITGKIKTKELKMIWFRDGKEEPASYPPEEYEVLGTAMLGSSKVYITNQWYKDYRNEPLVISEDMVDTFTPYPQLTEEE